MRRGAARPLPVEQANALDFQRFYEEHGAFVHSLVCRLLGPSADADDLTQEVFIVALKSRPGGSLESPRGWLSEIAVRVVSNARRSRWLRRVVRQPPPPDSLVEWRTPEHAAQARECTQELYAILDTLPEKKRTVFILYEMQEMSCVEIARALGCPIQTVYTRLHYARRTVLERFLAARAARERAEGGGSHD